MQSQRTVREPEREPAVAPSEETAPPRLTPRQEAERRANMTAAISLEQSILSGPPLPAGVVGLVAFNGQQQPPEDASMFAAGRLSILEIHISEDADVAAIQRSGLQRLREEMARYPPDASPVTIKEEGGVITLTNRCFLPFTNDEREELNGLMQSVMNLDSESMAAFHDVYTKLVYYARNFFVSSRGREISFFGAYEEAGGIYEEVAQRSSEVQDLLFSSLRKIAEGRRAEVEVDSVNNAVEQLYSAYYDSAYYRIGYALDRAFGDGQADAADLLDRAQRMGILSQLELGLLGQLVEEYASLSLKISEIKDKIAAYMLGMPEYQAGTTERMALPHGGGEVHLPTQEEREMFLDFMDVCGALALFSARLDFEEAFEPYLRYRDEAYSVHRPEGGTFGIDEWMGRQLQINNLPSDVANAMGRIGELGEFRAKMQGYGAMIANYSRSVLHSDDFVSMVDSRVLQARSEDFSFADEEIRESTRSAETVRGISSYLGSLGGAINSVQALGEEIPGMRKDRELFERFHTGDFWDKLYSYSEYFMRHGAADFLFWSTLAAGAIGAGATLASSVSRGAARVLAADLTELVAGREISVLGVPTAAAAAEAAAPTLLRQSLGFGYRMAADIDLLMGLPVFANAMRYFAGDRSDEVYQDLNLMATFMLMRAGGGGGGFLPRLTSAAGTIAAGTRFKEDIRRGEIWQAIQDGTVTAVGGAMFVRTTAGVLSFADSASASGTGMFATATGTKALDFLRGAATRLAPVGTVLEWGTEAYTAPGFLGIYGFHMINQCVSMWWREVPLPAMDYEGGGFTALREYFSSTYTEGANFMPFMSIAFRTIGAGWSAATSRYWRPTQGLAGISSNGFALV
ncbi:MAG: hypothetical protein NTY83_04010, partial [Candidatus Micrarchaeota archaeon]|nr:hypothetical protein [Candidatus Micrarchaeota archaeon]